MHAGVDEEAGEYWVWGTSDYILLGKFPATKGKFYKTIVAGHVGTGTWSLADDPNYHDVFTMEKVITILMARSIKAGNYCCWYTMKRMGSIIK